ncbi:MAG: 4-(cytidine 5'-diphospho)-2-C-methyl-D-erythritol kinase [Bacteroidetes bacterium]|nr:4-(cytidine 5'-diphospho)-2-C-methyl-D-erythritol kinase [Bacteroidota bacterium]
MVSFPHCKINLGLHVVAKRSDGFHDIETCFYPVPRTDMLEVIRAAEFSVDYSGIAVPGRAEDNLCIKAYQLLKKDFELSPVKIHLHKSIPMGAGLGGGSSDAAFTLRTLNSLFHLHLNAEQLQNYAAQLGSDCAFFLEDKPKIGTGRGEVLTAAQLELGGWFLVLVKPDVHVSTAEAYAGITPAKPEISVQEIVRLPVGQWKDKLVNDFEKTIFKKYPQIQGAKEKLYSLGATYACMSGSGASVFGLFEKPVDLKQDFPGMDYWSGELK